MEHFFVRRLARLFVCLVLGITAACQRTNQAEQSASPTPENSPSQVATANNTALAITGPVSPASVAQNTDDSFTSYLHYPKDPDASKLDGAVQFYCDVTETGVVEAVHALVGNNDAFKEAVQTALDWGHFSPATVNGTAVRSYLGGTVLFIHRGAEEIIVVSLATFDRDRVGKLVNYIQPQLLGGLRYTLEKQIATLTRGVLVPGRAEVVVHVDDHGKVTGTSAITENPKDSGLGILLAEAVRKAQFTPAYENGKPVAGGINVVADFTKF
jgi:outer membrane biosynthesis protein TonB